MAGVLADNPKAKPPEVPGDYGPGSVPPWESYRLKRHRPGRPRKLWLFPKAVLHWSRHGGTLEEAYRAIAEGRSGAIAPEFAPDNMTDAEFDKAFDRWDTSVKSVKRQVARERAWAREQEALDRARDQGGVLGK